MEGMLYCSNLVKAEINTIHFKPFTFVRGFFYSLFLNKKIMNQTVLNLIGNTPMVKVNQLDTGVCNLYLKIWSLLQTSGMWLVPKIIQFTFLLQIQQFISSNLFCLENFLILFKIEFKMCELYKSIRELCNDSRN